MNRVILLWEEIPESRKLYDMVLSAEDLARLRTFHGRFINMDDVSEEDINWILSQLNDYEPGGPIGPWAKFKVNTETDYVVDGPCTVILSGFFL